MNCVLTRSILYQPIILWMTNAYLNTTSFSRDQTSRNYKSNGQSCSLGSKDWSLILQCKEDQIASLSETKLQETNWLKLLFGSRNWSLLLQCEEDLLHYSYYIILILIVKIPPILSKCHMSSYHSTYASMMHMLCNGLNSRSYSSANIYIFISNSSKELMNYQDLPHCMILHILLIIMYSIIPTRDSLNRKIYRIEVVCNSC